MITASSVPICVIAVNVAPGSPHPVSAPTMRRCALDEIGRNSVSPCTRPRMIASRKSTRTYPTPSAVAQEIAEHRASERERRQRHPLVDPVEHRREVELRRQLQGRETVTGDAEAVERLVVGSA